MLTTWTSSLGPMTIAPLPNTEGETVGVDGPGPLAGAVLFYLIREREGDRLSRFKLGARPAEIDGPGALHVAPPVTEHGADNHDRKRDVRVGQCQGLSQWNSPERTSCNSL